MYMPNFFDFVIFLLIYTFFATCTFVSPIKSILAYAFFCINLRNAKQSAITTNVMHGKYTERITHRGNE